MKKGIIITILILSIIMCNKVKALTITSEVQPSGSEIWTQGTSGFYEDNWKYYFELDANSTAFEYGFRPTDNSAIRENEDYIEIPFYYSYPSLQISNEYAYNETVCSEWMMANNYWTCQRYIQPRNEIPVAIQTDIDSFTFMIRMKLNNDTTVNCSIESNNIVCPLYKQKPKELLLIVNYIQYSDTRIRFGFSKMITYYKSSNSQLQETIENTTQTQIESNQVCKDYDKNSIKIDNNALMSNGQLGANSNYGITDYINVVKANMQLLSTFTEQNNPSGYMCYYNINKTLISCTNLGQIGRDRDYVTFPNNTTYIRVSIQKALNKPTFRICQNGNQAIMDSDHTYDNTGEDITNQTQDFEAYEQEERDILDSLDFSGIENITIGGSTNARTFVWELVDRIRGMSSYIVMVMTSVLGMGLIKMVLNR